MKKILTIGLVAIFLAGCGQGTIEDVNEPTDINPQDESLDQVSEEELTEKAQAEQAILENDLSVYKNNNESELSLDSCNDFQDSTAKSSCEDLYYFEKAQIDQDSSLCENIKADEIKSDCKSEF